MAFYMGDTFIRGFFFPEVLLFAHEATSHLGFFLDSVSMTAHYFLLGLQFYVGQYRGPCLCSWGSPGSLKLGGLLFGYCACFWVCLWEMALML